MASSTYAQADVLTAANDLGSIADQLSAQLKDGYSFAIGVTEGINYDEFAATHGESQYHFKSDQVIAFNDAYNNLVGAQTMIAQEFLDDQIMQNETMLSQSIDNFSNAASQIMYVVEVAQEASTVTTQQEAVAVQEHVAMVGGEITQEMQVSYNTALTDITDYSRNISVLKSARNNAEVVDYLNQEFLAYDVDPYMGTVDITAQYDLMIDVNGMGMGVSGMQFFAQNEKANDIFVGYGMPLYDQMFGNNG